jgi:hypothetical protein
MQPETQQQPTSNWQFHAEGAQVASPTQSAQPAAIGPIEWTASEYISHSKSPSWYLALIGGAVVFGAIIYLLTKDIISVVSIAVVALVFGIAASRKPRVLHYSIDAHGIKAGQKYFPLGSFKSFSVIQEGPVNSIYLLPLKRLMPALTMYYPPEEEKKILDALSSFLPEERRQQDTVDRLMRKIRF